MTTCRECGAAISEGPSSAAIAAEFDPTRCEDAWRRMAYPCGPLTGAPPGLTS